MKKNNGSSSFGKIVTIIVLAIVLCITVFKLIPAYKSYADRKEELKKQQAANARLKKELSRRNVDVNALENSPAAVEKVAREKYNQVKDGETVMTYSVPGQNEKK